MFRFPDVYKVGVAIAPMPDQQLYDSIYEERYMGLPKDNAEGYRLGSPINFAEGLKGNLLIIHGTGDDNVHYQGTERLINRLVALGKPFDMMAYPNRTHAIAEGPGDDAPPVSPDRALLHGSLAADAVTARWDRPQLAGSSPISSSGFSSSLRIRVRRACAARLHHCRSPVGDRPVCTSLSSVRAAVRHLPRHPRHRTGVSHFQRGPASDMRDARKTEKRFATEKQSNRGEQR
jgi:hypothetical protein